MSTIEKNELFDYYQEVARSAFADMLHDTERNRKYAMAIKEAIETMKSRGKRANVLDIGTGTGLLAMLAAQYGADTVTTIEAFSPVSHIARKIIATNGFRDKIKIINKHSTEVNVGKGKDIEERANILVTEVFDTELIGEGAIKTYNHAHHNLMESDCICVPDSASIYLQIVDCPETISWNTFRLTRSLEFDCLVENIDKCSGSPAIHDIQLSQLPTSSFRRLGGPLEICSFDFSGKSQIKQNEKFTKQFDAVTDGQANTVFFWWNLKMNPSGSILLSCAPHWVHPDTESLAHSKNEIARRNAIPWRDHWMQGCFYIKSRLQLKAGDRPFVSAYHDEFSWWFDICYEVHKDLLIERPKCTCLFHIVNSRNRIMQINDFSRISPYMFRLEQEQKSYLFVGDCNILAMAVGKESKVFLLQEDPLCYKSMSNIVSENVMNKRVKLIKNLKDIRQVINCLVAEPHYNSAVLPWDNITFFWKQIQQLKQHQKQSFSISPSGVSIKAIPVRFLNLHKIRWPLKSTCEGFDHQLFDNVVEVASSLADENVEPFSLWEYPCVALGAPVSIYHMSFDDETIPKMENTIQISDFNGTCNGIALWVEWKVDETSSNPCGPSSEIIIGELVSWKMSERQGVHLIPYSKIKAGTINRIAVTTFFDKIEEKLAMNFSYQYKTL